MCNLTNTEDKEKDYDCIIRNIDTTVNIGNIVVINNMIDLFDNKWNTKESKCELKETNELRCVLKYRIKKMAENKHPSLSE
jgi:hypothetical protein